MEAQIADALRTELSRQAGESGGTLKVAQADAGRITVEGPLDLEALAMAVAGSVAGGP